MLRRRRVQVLAPTNRGICLALSRPEPRSPTLAPPAVQTRVLGISEASLGYVRCAHFQCCACCIGQQNSPHAPSILLLWLHPTPVEGAGFEEGKAIIKLYDHDTGKASLLVAGYSAIDTVVASRVVAYNDIQVVSALQAEIRVENMTSYEIAIIP